MSPLSEKNRENIIRLLQEGKPLPEMYKSALFPSDDKEYIELTKVYQLVYQGKKRKEDVIAETLEAPLQEVRAFNAENPFPDGWRNMLIFGDNLMALKSLYEDQRGPDKYRDGKRHFEELNKALESKGIPQRYWFKFITPTDYDDFFAAVRSGGFRNWKSELMSSLG